jgi:hypothetical protein
MEVRGFVAAGVLMAMTACGGGTTKNHPSEQRAQGAGKGAVAASVNGEPIRVSEVAAVVSASGLSPRDALSRLVDERLLAQYAESRGYGELRSVEIEVVRARVRALLEAAVEREIRPETIPAERVAERFEQLRNGPGGSDLQLADQEAKIRQQLTLEARRDRLQGVIEQLKKQTKVIYDEPTIKKALADGVAAGTGT